MLTSPELVEQPPNPFPYFNDDDARIEEELHKRFIEQPDDHIELSVLLKNLGLLTVSYTRAA